LEKFPEGKIQEIFQVSPAETKESAAPQAHGGALEAAYEHSDTFGKTGENAHCADAGIGSPCQEGVYSTQTVNAK